MTNEELKRKIVEVIREFRDSKPIVPNGYGLQIISGSTDRELADALIAEGLKFDTVVSHTATFDLMQQKQINSLERRCAQAEYRAARAERAFKIYLKDTPECEECIDRMNGVCNANIEEKADCANSAFRLYKEYAEKELAEERKDEQS